MSASQLGDTNKLDLLTWAKEHETTLHENVEIYNDPDTGLSFRARCTIEQHTTIVSSTYKTSLSYLNAIDNPPTPFNHQSIRFPPKFIAMFESNPAAIGRFFLVQQYLKGSDSFWHPYIRLLPNFNQPETLNFPVLWNKADEAFLDGTNMGFAVKARRGMWEAEWRSGVLSLQEHNFPGWEKYTCPLYLWAASMFASRSYRASLSLNETLFQDCEESLKARLIQRCRTDEFSVLYPVLDIGNHNGNTGLSESADSLNALFKLIARRPFVQNEQIFNYYGAKNNNELLLGYGFMLNDPNNDAVELILRPNPEMASLRRSTRSQPSQGLDIGDLGNDFRYNVTLCALAGSDLNKFLSECFIFSHGYLDTCSCMLANRREQKFIFKNHDYFWPNRSEDHKDAVLNGPLIRNFLYVLFETRVRLQEDLEISVRTGTDLQAPCGHSKNQLLALDYRRRQMAILKNAIEIINHRLTSEPSYDTLPRHGTDEIDSSNSRSLEILSLDGAYRWLNTWHQDISSTLEDYISKDQEELLPLNWTALIKENWDHTYWTIWIYVVSSVWLKNKEEFILTNSLQSHRALARWLTEMKSVYDDELALDPSNDRLYATPSEESTINETTQHIRDNYGLDGVTWEYVRNFASFTAWEEGIKISYVPNQDIEPQRMMCIDMKGAKE